jgi:hypothetical protein
MTMTMTIVDLLTFDEVVWSATYPSETDVSSFHRETLSARFIFPSHLRHSIERQAHMLQAGRFSERSSKCPCKIDDYYPMETDRSVERDCVFDAHFPRFSRKDHHRPTSSHSIAFKTTK